MSTARAHLVSFVGLLRRVSDRADDHDADIMAAGLSFYALLGLFPALLSLVSIYGLVSDPAHVEGVVAEFAQTLPPQARTLVLTGLSEFVQRSSGDLTLSVVLGIVAVLWSSSSGVSVLVHAINVAYGVKDPRTFVGRRAFALLFTFVGVVGVAVVVPAVTFVPKVFHLVGADTLLILLPPAALGVAAFLTLLVLFRYAPYGPALSFREVAPGAAAASVAWLVVSGAYSVYVRFFARMTSTYGALEGVIVLELWFYFSTLLLLYAAELNVELRARRYSATDEVANRREPGDLVGHELEEHQ